MTFPGYLGKRVLARENIECSSSERAGSDYYSPTPEPLADEGARQATGFSAMVNGSAPRSTGVPGRDSRTGAHLAPEPADVRETAPTGREDAPSAPPPWSP